MREIQLPQFAPCDFEAFVSLLLASTLKWPCAPQFSGASRDLHVWVRKVGLCMHEMPRETGFTSGRRQMSRITLYVFQ